MKSWTESRYRRPGRENRNARERNGCGVYYFSRNLRNPAFLELRITHSICNIVLSAGNLSSYGFVKNLINHSSYPIHP